METGTGKTYVYTETMFELNAHYGWSKFIIVVPSVAIREGVAKSLQITAKHFHESYGKQLWAFVYNSSRLNEIDSFASRADISVMVINMQAFNAFDASKNKEGRGGDKTARIMFSERDDFGSRRPIDVLSATTPILIIDEPQKMGKKTGATRKAMQQFNPLFSLNYSATHKERHNTVFALDPLDAYNERLVKRIEVKGIEMVGMRGTDGYVYLQDIQVSPTRPPRAVIEFTQQLKGGALKRTTRTFDELDNIYQASGELETYAHGYRILRIVPDQNGQTGYVEFDNHERLYRGQVANDSSEEDLRRIQIRETIASHLQKEEVLFRQGIKCLSLFFIDEVAKYRVYDEDGSEGVGEYGRIFEEEYARAIAERTAVSTLDDAYDPAYLRYLRSFDPHQVHKGYFSIDKKGRACNSKLKRGSEFAEGEDAVAAYDLILKNKERLLSFEEPCRFIFSHSALREGWDNPNVFQICTLKASSASRCSSSTRLPSTACTTRTAPRAWGSTVASLRRSTPAPSPSARLCPRSTTRTTRRTCATCAASIRIRCTRDTSQSTRRDGPATASSSAAVSSPRGRTPWPPTTSSSRTRSACSPLRSRADSSSRTPRYARAGTTPTCSRSARSRARVTPIFPSARRSAAVCACAWTKTARARMRHCSGATACMR